MTFKWLSYKTITKMKVIVSDKIKDESPHPLSARAIHNTVFFTYLYTHIHIFYGAEVFPSFNHTGHFLR